MLSLLYITQQKRYLIMNVCVCVCQNLQMDYDRQSEQLEKEKERGEAAEKQIAELTKRLAAAVTQVRHMTPSGNGHGHDSIQSKPS